MSDGSLAAVVAAARTLLPELSTLLGVEADGVRHELEDLIDRAERGEPVADQIMTLLRSRPATRDRVMALLATGPQDTAAAAAAVSQPPPPPRPRRRLAEPGGGGGASGRSPLDVRTSPRAAGTSHRLRRPPRDLRRPPRVLRTTTRLRSAPRPRKSSSRRTAIDPADAPPWILSQVWDLADPAEPRRMKRAFHARSRHTIKVRIGPIDDEWFVAEGRRRRIGGRPAPRRRGAHPGSDLLRARLRREGAEGGRPPGDGPERRGDVLAPAVRGPGSRGSVDQPRLRRPAHPERAVERVRSRRPGFGSRRGGDERAVGRDLARTRGSRGSRAVRRVGVARRASRGRRGRLGRRRA